MAIRILGGEGANRLFGVLRTDRGLTYGASADLHAYKNGGDIVAETDTRSPATGEALRLMVDEFCAAAAEPVDIRRAAGRAGFHVRQLSADDRDAVGDRRAGAGAAVLRPGSDGDRDVPRPRRARDGRPTSSACRAQFLKPDQLSIVLVGDASAFVDQLKALGFTEFERIPLAAARSELADAAAHRAGRPRTTAA